MLRKQEANSVLEYMSDFFQLSNCRDKINMISKKLGCCLQECQAQISYIF